MYRQMLKSKIHRATVTDASLHYVGSLTLDTALIEEAGLLNGELVQVVNINNGARLETYVIDGPRDSGVVCANGAAARLIQPGDLVIIMSYAIMAEQEARSSVPRVVFVDGDNHIVGHGDDLGAAIPDGSASPQALTAGSHLS